MKTRQTLFPLLVLICTITNLYGAEIPYLTGRVNDYAQILSESTATNLSDALKAHEDKTTNQVVILTVSTIDGESIEDYAYQVFQEWGLGQKDKNNGILIVVVPDDRRMRIEVGYGLEGTMTDLMAGRIIRDIMTPKFKEGDYDTGIADGTMAVISVLDGESLPEPETTESSQSVMSGFDEPELPIVERILLGAFIFGIIGLFTFLGIVTPGFGWFMYFFLIPFWAMFPIVIFGTKGAMICFMAYMILFPAIKLYLKTTKWYKKAKIDIKTKGSASIGGMRFYSGGSGSSWSSGGSSSGRSSFSGGGGRSGGGGSSGSW